VWHSRQAGIPPVHLVSGQAVSRGARARRWPARDERRRGSLTSFATIGTLSSVKLQIPACDNIAYSFGYPFPLGAVIRQRRALLSRDQHAPAVLLQIGYGGSNVDLAHRRGDMSLKSRVCEEDARTSRQRECALTLVSHDR
jgi:hypothetical protein